MSVQRMYLEFHINFPEISEPFMNFVEMFRILNFICISFSKIFRTLPNNPAEIFKAFFKLYSQNFYINTLTG